MLRVHPCKICAGLLALVAWSGAVECDAPGWLNAPVPLLTNSAQAGSFGYFKGIGVGSSAAEASQKAQSDALAKFGLTITEQFAVTSSYKKDLREVSRNQATQSLESDVQIQSQILGSGQISTPRGTVHIVAEQNSLGACTDGKHHDWFLFCRAGAGISCQMESPSSLGAMARSALLPGWGQAYKTRKQRGALFLTAFATGLAGTFIAQRIASDSHANAIESRTLERKKFFLDQENDALLVRSIFLVSTGMVWSLNIFDAFTLPGTAVLK